MNHHHRSFEACIIFALWGIVIVVLLKSSVSTPRRPPTAFHSGAQWRLLLPRKSQQRTAICDSEKIWGSATSLASSNANENSILDRIAQAFGIGRRNAPLSSATKSYEPKSNKGQVIRTAARPHQASGGSISSSPNYTTRKPSLPLIAVSETGVTGDYNHYRTVALKSTANRAISILTTDVNAYMRTLDNGYFANKFRDGDLGENVLVEVQTYTKKGGE